MRYLSAMDPEDLNVLVRLDLDLPQKGKSFDTTRLEDSLETLGYLWKSKAKHVTVIAHRGHHPKASDSLEPIADLLYDKMLVEKAFKNATRDKLEEWLDVLENLRFDPREEANDPNFAKELAEGQDLFVNDAFATSHREHTSIVGVPKVLQTVFGFQFAKEMTVLEKLTGTPKRPFLFILGGAKLDDKLQLLEKIGEHVDVILLGGKLAAEAREKEYKHRRMIIAQLTDDGLDITPTSNEQFERFVLDAKTLVWNGPMGYFEDGKHAAGTKALIESISKSNAYKVAGGGDTEAAMTQLKVDQGKIFNHVSSGGGALLHYLAFRTLPALEVVG